MQDALVVDAQGAGGPPARTPSPVKSPSLREMWVRGAISVGPSSGGVSWGK